MSEARFHGRAGGRGQGGSSANFAADAPLDVGADGAAFESDDWCCGSTPEGLIVRAAEERIVLHREFFLLPLAAFAFALHGTVEHPGNRGVADGALQANERMRPG